VTKNALMVAILGLASCSQPETVADCAGLRSAQDREQCRWDKIAPLADDPDAVETALAQVEPAESRDLIRLRLSIAHPTRASAWCRTVETSGAQEKCRQVLGRPHLGTAPRAPKAPAGGPP
jgi:hypothetical protein